MDVAIFSTQELPFVLRSLTNVAANPAALTPREQQFLQVMEALHQSRNTLIASPSTHLAHIAQVIRQPHHRKRLLQMAIVIAMVDGQTTLAQQQALRDLARAIAIKEAGLRVLQEAARGQRRLARFNLFRRMMKKLIVPAFRDEGMAGVKKIIASLFFKQGNDPAVARRYHQLGQLPVGTLGYAFWQHYTQNHFPFPGEPGGIPERLVFHDLGHLLAGYDTDPAGEIQQGAFQAGFIRQDGFAFLLFVILQFHWDIKITPIAASAQGYFDIPRVLHALQRGSACKVDLSDHWDFWEVVAQPLEVVRERYGIPPFCPPEMPQRLLSPVL